ncbi:hypothetical protein Dimus_037456, partial [Dionaea muscipula]
SECAQRQEAPRGRDKECTPPTSQAAAASRPASILTQGNPKWIRNQTHDRAAKALDRTNSLATKTKSSPYQKPAANGSSQHQRNFGSAERRHTDIRKFPRKLQEVPTKQSNKNHSAPKTHYRRRRRRRREASENPKHLRMGQNTEQQPNQFTP